MMRDFREQDYYELLDVKPHASQEELESSYQRARRFFSSDSVATYALFQPDELVLLRRRISEAYRVLIDPERRRRYDREMMRIEEGEWPDNEPAAAEEAGQAEPPAAEADERQLSLKVVEEAPDAEQEQPAPEAPEKSAAPKNEDEEPPAVAADAGQDVFRKLSREAKEADLEEKPAEQQASQPETEKEPEPEHEPESVSEQENLAPPPRIDEQTDFSGELLSQVRRAKGISLEQIADTSKISIYYLRKIESEDFDELPAKVYIRGYLKQIAAILGLNPQSVTDSYLKRMDSTDGQET